MSWQVTALLQVSLTWGYGILVRCYSKPSNCFFVSWNDFGWHCLLYLWIKLVMWPGRSNCLLLWAGAAFGRSSSTRGACGTRKNRNVRMHKSTSQEKKLIFIKGLTDRMRKSWILLEKVAGVPHSKICLLLCLTDPKKQAGPKVKNRPWSHFSHKQMLFLSQDLLFIVSLPWHQVRYCSIWKWNHEKPLVFTVILEPVQGYYRWKRMLEVPISQRKTRKITGHVVMA